MEAFELLISGNFMGLIKAEVFVAANYPKYGLSGINFHVIVEVDLYALNKVCEKYNEFKVEFDLHYDKII